MAKSRAGKLILLLVLVVGLVGVGLLVVRVALAAILPAGAVAPIGLAGNDPDVVLDAAMIEFATNRGYVSPATMRRVAQASRRAPLDARPFLLSAVQALARGENARALAALEAGRLLDGRQRWIRLLLLDRYLRTNRYTDAGIELAVLARLVSSARSPILTQLAAMARAPGTREAVRRTLARDPILEQQVLATLAKADPDPRLLFSLASPSALAAAGGPESWGQALVEALLARREFRAARAVWLRVYAVPQATAAEPLYDARLAGLPGGAPFNWTFAAGGIGAADRRAGSIQIAYYGRESGDLTTQLLTLLPGAYRFGYVLSSSGSNDTIRSLSWTIICADTKTALANAPLPPGSGTRRRHIVPFTVPASGCRAQQLSLTGTATEFPTSIDAEISGLSLARVEEGQ